MTAAERPPQTRGRTIGWARWYDVGSWLMSFGRIGAIRRAALDLAAPAPGEKVLDVGCGTGTLALAAQKRVGPSGEVHGIDASPPMIEVAQKKAARKRADVRFQVALIEDLPFPEGEFDLALNTFMLHHLPDDLKVQGLAEVRRVLKPGGRVLVVDFGAQSHSPLGHLLALFGHGHGHGGGAVADAVREAGFAPVEEPRTKFRQLSFVLGRKEGES